MQKATLNPSKTHEIHRNAPRICSRNLIEDIFFPIDRHPPQKNSLFNPTPQHVIINPGGILINLSNLKKQVPAKLYNRGLDYFEREFVEHLTESAAGLIEELQFMYPKRRALLDELGKIN
ncbi:hypothetical protein MKY84_02640 [Chryseomicrobium sp. FSL W7-1435]|nr:hypothetical protein [Chryseomicrobium aureum]MBM7707619.1 hypothetical protein [Chryseomicrobium aureum]